MARQTPMRPLNQCHDCGYTWYPRGKDVSHRCPRCSSTDTGIDYTGLYVILFLMGVFLAVSYWYIAIPLGILCLLYYIVK
jgi:hypothetical protein